KQLRLAGEEAIPAIVLLRGIRWPILLDGPIRRARDISVTILGRLWRMLVHPALPRPRLRAARGFKQLHQIWGFWREKLFVARAFKGRARKFRFKALAVPPRRASFWSLRATR